MGPLWARARSAGVRIVKYRGEAHPAQDDSAVVFAEFVFTIAAPGSATREVEFVQKLRVVDEEITSMTEYSVPDVSASFQPAA